VSHGALQCRSFDLPFRAEFKQFRFECCPEFTPVAVFTCPENDQLSSPEAGMLPRVAGAAFRHHDWVFILILFLLMVPRSNAQNGDFTVIAVPDTQYYSESYPQILNSQMQWIVNNASALNIQMVLGLGDIVNAGGTVSEWGNADAAYKLLDAAHIPYFAAIGNHDYDANNPGSRTSATKNFNNYFGPGRYSSSGYWKGSYPSGSNENFYGVLTINGQPFLVLALEFYPRDSSLAWAAQVIQNNSDKQIIIITHSYEYFDNTRVSACNSFDAQYYGLGADNDGDAMWSKLVRQYKNITLVLSGHEVRGAGQDAAGHRMDVGVNGNLVNQILSDYQNMTNGGNGYLRIMKFHPSTDTIDVLTYSPYLNSYLADSTNQFTVPWHNWTGTGNGSIVGVVKDISSCSPLPATITSSVGSSVATSSGTYTLSNLAPSTYNIMASYSGYTSVSRSIQVGPALAGSGKLFLGKGSGQVTGKITDSSGSPLSGATVQLTGSSSASAQDETATTDASGNYSSGSVAGGTYQMTASATGYAASSATVSLTAGATVTQNFALTPSSTPPPQSASVSVTSITPNSGPTTGGTVVNIAGANFVAGASVTVGSAAAAVSSVTSTSISATVPPGTAGSANVSVTNPNGAGTATLTGGFNYTSPSTTTGTISGQVTRDDTTVALPGATVAYSGGSTSTNSSGAFTLSNVPAGNVSVAASIGGYQIMNKPATVTAGATGTLNFALLPNCTINTADPSVTICLPSANSTVLNPVHVIAKATDSHPVNNLQVWVDYVKRYQLSGGSLNANISMSTGVTHRVTIQATDNINQVVKQTLYVTVH
jgi:hypothetical protein